jgi:N6-adenosine-specific RNA methylase IME4
MSFEEIGALPVREISAEKSHLYLWCPNALLAEALSISVGVPTKLRRGRS